VVRGAAASLVAASIAVPLLRKRLRIPQPVTFGAVVAGPLALAVLQPRTRRRDATIYALQMWGFLHVKDLAYDDPERLARRLRVDYPIRADLALAGGELPTVRLQRLLARPGEVTRLDRVLTWVHWVWFFEPHLSLAWILVSDTDRFPRAARQMAVAYDLGCLIYHLVPTAPPWWAASEGHISAEGRRLMVEVGEETWKGAWPRMYDSLGGNPWAAMPSLHFGTSVMAAILLSESGPVRGAAGWSYALTLGFALVYLGEHYVIDLIAGAALVAFVRKGERYAEPVADVASRVVQRLERVANE
jgi:membrane-associated phospholipid phosphatase